MSRFRLYQTEQHWWSFADYAAVLEVMDRIPHRSVLEFGPGSSTLALIEGGALQVDSCEDDAKWLHLYLERIQRRFPTVVTLRPYEWSEPLIVPGLAERYDMALIDGPRNTERRPEVIEFALARCDAVLVPLEESGDTPYLRPAVHALAARHGRQLEITATGPLAGSFALLT